MAARRRYESSNGDTWDLIYEGWELRIRHQPNAASGGRTTDYDLIVYLSSNRRTPQGQALVDLIATLVEDS